MRLILETWWYFFCHIADLKSSHITGNFPGLEVQGGILAWPMMTSSNGNIFHVTGPLWGESTGHRWLPLARPVTRSFDVFFVLRLNKWMSKQSRHQRFEMPSGSLWHHCNGSHYCFIRSHHHEYHIQALKCINPLKESREFKVWKFVLVYSLKIVKERWLKGYTPQIKMELRETCVGS